MLLRPSETRGETHCKRVIDLPFTYEVPITTSPHHHHHHHLLHLCWCYSLLHSPRLSELLVVRLQAS